MRFEYTRDGQLWEQISEERARKLLSSCYEDVDDLLFGSVLTIGGKAPEISEYRTIFGRIKVHRKRRTA